MAFGNVGLKRRAGIAIQEPCTDCVFARCARGVVGEGPIDINDIASGIAVLDVETVGVKQETKVLDPNSLMPIRICRIAVVLF